MRNKEQLYQDATWIHEFLRSVLPRGSGKLTRWSERPQTQGNTPWQAYHPGSEMLRCTCDRNNGSPICRIPHRMEDLSLRVHFSSSQEEFLAPLYQLVSVSDPSHRGTIEDGQIGWLHRWKSETHLNDTLGCLDHFDFSDVVSPDFRYNKCSEIKANVKQSVPCVVLEEFCNSATKIECFAEERNIYLQTRFVTFLSSSPRLWILGKFELWHDIGSICMSKLITNGEHWRQGRCPVFYRWRRTALLTLLCASYSQKWRPLALLGALPRWMKLRPEIV